MTVLLSANLPDKFKDRILSYELQGPITDGKTLKTRLDEVYRSQSKSNLVSETSLLTKPHIKFLSNLPDFIIKTARDQSDTHLYRVRKADKIRRLLKEHQYTDLAVVPEKWLYHTGNEWIVIAEKLELFKGYVKYFCCGSNGQWFAALRDSTGGERNEYNDDDDGKNYQVTPEQGTALAMLAFEAGLSDLGVTNVLFTSDGKIAIIDTEPIERTQKKAHPRWGYQRSIEKTLYGLYTMVHLKRVCIDSQTVMAIESVERHYYYKTLIRVAAMLTLITVAALKMMFILNKAILARGLNREYSWSLGLASFLFLLIELRPLIELRQQFCQNLEVSKSMLRGISVQQFPLKKNSQTSKFFS